jgi:DNA-binding NarL/FixJ family response regulator
MIDGTGLGNDATSDCGPHTGGQFGSHVLLNDAWESVARRFHLSTPELRIVQAIFDGLTEMAMADQFQVSPHTIHSQFRGLYSKLGVSNRVAVVLVVLSPFLSNTPKGVA